VRTRAGRGLVGLAAGLVAVGLAAFLYPPVAWLVPAVLLAALALSAADLAQLRKHSAAVQAQRTLPPSVARGTPFEVRVRLSNRSAAQLESEVRDVLPAEAQPAYWSARGPLAAAQDTVWRYTVCIPTRGRYTFGPLWVRFIGRFRMLEGQRALACTGSVKVLPESALPQGSLAAQLGLDPRPLARLAHARLRGEGMEFESLSEFREGDDPRRIDWRSSARLRRLMVRRYQLEHHRDVVILVDCGRLMGASAGTGSKLDRAVDAALRLSRLVLEEGDRCGLGLFDDQVLGLLPPQGGRGAHQVILEALYDVQSRWRETNFSPMFARLQRRQAKRSLIVVLSDLVDAETSEQFRGALAALAKRHVVVFAALQTPLLGEVVRAPVNDALDVARKAVALRLLRQREKALLAVDRSGVHLLDVEPEQLTVPLLNRYIQLRERNLV